MAIYYFTVKSFDWMINIYFLKPLHDAHKKSTVKIQPSPPLPAELLKHYKTTKHKIYVFYCKLRAHNHSGLHFSGPSVTFSLKE